MLCRILPLGGGGGDKDLYSKININPSERVQIGGSITVIFTRGSPFVVFLFVFTGTGTGSPL